MDQQIAAVRAALAAIESAIAQTEAALRAAANPQDVFALTAALADLKAERAKLQLQLASLEAAAVEVGPLGGRTRGRAAGVPARAAAPGRMAAGQSKRAKSLEKGLRSAVTDRSVAAATLALATNVIGMAKAVRMIGDGGEPATIGRPGGRPMATGTRAGAVSGRARARKRAK